MPGAVEILQGLGAERQRDGSWRLDVRALRLTSIFGGPLHGDGALTVRGDDVAFVRPAELAVCEGLSLRGLDDADGFRELVADLHGDMRARANAHLATLRRLGFKPAILAPIPRPRADVVVGGATATVSVSGSGHLVVDAVDGDDVPAALGAIAAAAGLTPADALRRIGVVVDNLANRGTATNAGDQLSQDDLDELHNALHDELDDSDEGGAFDDDDDDDEDEDDEYEPTVAGVPPPQRRDDVRLAPRVDQARPPGGHDWDGGTAPSAAAGRSPFDHDRPATIEAVTADIVRTVRPMSAVTLPAPDAPRAGAGRDGGLLDEFDDDDGIPPDGGRDDVADEHDNPSGKADASDDAEGGADGEDGEDGFEFVDDDASVSLEDDEDAASDPLADVATAAMNAPPTRAEPAVAPPGRDVRAASPQRTVPPQRSADDEENDLLAALGGDDDAGGDDALAGRPTTISVTPRAARDLVSASADVPRPRAGAPASRVPVLGDDRGGAAPAPPPSSPRVAAAAAPARATPPPPGVDDDEFGAAAGFDDDDDFAGAKTRALSVDAALLDRLKRGDIEAPPGDADDAAPATEPPLPPASPLASRKPAGAPGATVAAAPLDDDDDGVNDDDDGADADGFDARAAVTRVGAGDPRTAVSPPADDVAARHRTAAPPAAPAPAPPAAAPRGASALDADASIPEPLRERPSVAVAREPVRAARGPDDLAELARLRARAAQLRQELDDVLARIELLASEQETTTTKPMPPPLAEAAPARQARPLGLSGLQLSSRAAASAAVAPPVVTDEGEFAAVGQSEDDDDGDVINSATTPQSVPAPRADAAAVVDSAGVAGDDGFAGGAAVDHGDDGDDGDDGADDEDGVSLADLQGALREMGVDVADEGTQVKAVDVPDDGGADDGDVFGSAGSAGGEDDLLVDESTNIRPPRPGTIALVVEDSRARDRLKRHLEPRFTALFEAEDARAAIDLDELDSLDAIVFVRPSRSEPNQQGFARIDRMSRRPRVLVISADAAYDEHPGVDLRLPLGQKASEVARQVLEGLERLGVQAAAE